MEIIAYILSFAFSVARFLILGWVVLSMLFQFGVLNQSNQALGKIYVTLTAFFYPINRYIRRYVPLFRGIDFSPVVMLFILGLLEITVFKAIF